MPLPTISPTEEAIVVEETESLPAATPNDLDDYSLGREYAAVWAVKEEGLHVRNPAGISASIVETIPWDSRQIFLTGNSSLLGSSLWLEIAVEGGITGWVNAWRLTEYVSAIDFCEDQRVIELLSNFQQYVLNLQDPSFEDLISPNHGLTIRHNWYSLDVGFYREDIQNLISDSGEINWGAMADTGLDILGSFSEIIQPKLDDVFLSSSEMFCNELQWGNTAGEIRWPDELVNLNFYSFYRPAVENGNAFDWRTWAVGIEYMDGQPFIAVLIHYSSEL